jgi:hypothetical protein
MSTTPSRAARRSQAVAHAAREADMPRDRFHSLTEYPIHISSVPPCSFRQESGTPSIRRNMIAQTIHFLGCSAVLSSFKSSAMSRVQRAAHGGATRSRDRMSAPPRRAHQ